MVHTWPPKKAEKQRQASVEMVRAETQAVLVRRLLGGESNWELTDFEFELLRRGRNSAGRGPVRLAADKAGFYGEATALETLVGFYYLSDRVRTHEFLTHLLELGEAAECGCDGTPPNWNPEAEGEEGGEEGGDNAMAGQ